ncbi:LytR/AlgR family response regulator transcription factor [Maribellus sediminis]|uniref:LytR/AlgR family response regulator transcription factor n=1 Tax=Maribellus sediminis TaxID=2696285 RepID=UPI001431F2F4|nr:LytTR family DNA-binding domain-containing protein [Maribellus sediminis]
MKAVIVEDEKYSVLNLQHLLKQYAPDIEIVEVFESGRQAIEKLPDLTFDLIFLDIQFNDDFDAFEMLKSWKWDQLQLIFVTSYSDYALKAFKFNAIDYLTKPIDKDELLVAIDKAKTRIFRKKELEKLISTVEALRNIQLIIRGQNETFFLPANKVLYLKAEKEYSVIHYFEGENVYEIVSSRHLGFWEKEFSEFPFLRIHKSYLVNMEHIVSFGNRKVKLTNGARLEMSRDRKQELELKIISFKSQY